LLLPIWGKGGGAARDEVIEPRNEKKYEYFEREKNVALDSADS